MELRAPAIEAVLASAEALAHLGSWALDLRTHEATWSDELYRIHGIEPGSAEPGVELLLGFVHPEDRERMAGLLERIIEAPQEVPREGLESEYRAVRPDGGVREIRFHGRVEHDAAGPAVWLGAAQDVTEQRVTERELEMHYALLQTLREWESFEEGVVALLRRLGTALDVATASLWVPDDSDRLACRAFWSAPGLDTAEIEAVTREVSFARGEGAPGRAWETGGPIVVADLERDPGSHRPDIVTALGLRAVFALPAAADGETAGVVAFYGTERVEPSAYFLRTLAALGDELGRVLTRHRGRIEPRSLSDRELEVLRLAAEGNSGPDIAERLVVSPSTIKTHFENIYEKLGVGDRAAAVAHALRIGLIS
jgi:PAS domain S-box-containing protein